MTVQPLTSRVPAQQPPPEDADEAFTALYRHYRSRVAAYLCRVAPDGDVEALTQETFCRALAHVTELAALADPWPWLAVTARNLSRNQTRIEAATAPAGLRIAGNLADRAPEPDEQAFMLDRIRRLCRALVTLSPVQRQLLTLLLSEGVTVAEAGRRLGMREATARQHLRRMRARVSAELASVGGRLAVVPLVAWRLVTRAARHPRLTRVGGSAGRAGIPYAALAAGVTIAATPFVAGVLHLGGSDGAPTTSRSRLHLRVGTFTEPSLRHLGEAAHTVPANAVAHPSQVSRLTVHQSLDGPVPATAHALVSKTPTVPGDVYVVSVTAGPAHVEARGELSGAPATPVCAALSGICSNG